MTIKEMIAEIIAKEGGYVNHPNDKGGPTNYGITAMSYAEYFKRNAKDITINEIKAVTAELAEKIYYTLYYVRPNIISLPPLIQPLMLDMAVNHGRRGSVKILQGALTSAGYSFSQPDGIIGAKTLTAAEKAVTDLGQNFITSLVNCRIDYYAEIIKNDPTQAVFKAGWIARAESFRPERA
jgi:lysozyme family protein